LVLDSARDAVANVVFRLRKCGFDPRKVGHDSWESRCPAHGSTDHALSITRDALNQVVLECRSNGNCQPAPIIRALGFTNADVYAETEDWLIERLSRVPIHPVSPNGAQSQENHEVGPTPAEQANGLAGTGLPPALDSSADATAAREDSSQEAVATQDVAGVEDEIQHAGAGGCAADLASPGGNPETVGRRLEATATNEAPACGAGLASPGVNPETIGRRLEATATIETSSIAEPSDELERLSAVGLLTRLAASARLFRSADGRFCAQVPVGDRLEIFGLRSAAMRDWLIDGYLVSQPEPPSSWAIRRVVGMLEARARFSSGVPEVFIRVGQDGVRRDSA
jgi:hypothetical protein